MQIRFIWACIETSTCPWIFKKTKNRKLSKESRNELHTPKWVEVDILDMFLTLLVQKLWFWHFWWRRSWKHADQVHSTPGNLRNFPKRFNGVFWAFLLILVSVLNWPTFMVLLTNITPLYVTNMCPFLADGPLWPVTVSVVMSVSFDRPSNERTTLPGSEFNRYL